MEELFSCKIQNDKECKGYLIIFLPSSSSWITSLSCINSKSSSLDDELEEHRVSPSQINALLY